MGRKYEKVVGSGDFTMLPKRSKRKNGQEKGPKNWGRTGRTKRGGMQGEKGASGRTRMPDDSETCAKHIPGQVDGMGQGIFAGCVARAQARGAHGGGAIQETSSASSWIIHWEKNQNQSPKFMDAHEAHLGGAKAGTNRRRQVKAELRGRNRPDNEAEVLPRYSWYDYEGTGKRARVRLNKEEEVKKSPIITRTNNTLPS
ncbi:hypothetical protein B0H11DRAFT_1914945 [Mycena galericulata]|nr:hypothetical protein B0H11DRAFT_1914945 [Mycena galericulata]